MEQAKSPDRHADNFAFSGAGAICSGPVRQDRDLASVFAGGGPRSCELDRHARKTVVRGPYGRQVRYWQRHRAQFFNGEQRETNRACCGRHPDSIFWRRLLLFDKHAELYRCYHFTFSDEGPEGKRRAASKAFFKRAHGRPLLCF